MIQITPITREEFINQFATWHPELEASVSLALLQAETLGAIKFFKSVPDDTFVAIDKQGRMVYTGWVEGNKWL